MEEVVGDCTSINSQIELDLKTLDSRGVTEAIKGYSDKLGKVVADMQTVFQDSTLKQHLER